MLALCYVSYHVYACNLWLIQLSAHAELGTRCFDIQHDKIQHYNKKMLSLMTLILRQNVLKLNVIYAEC
jgi:hypothetical protein